MERWLLAVAVLVAAVGVAALVDRRRRPALAPSLNHRLATHVDRADWPQATGAWALVVFSSATCDACASVRRAVAPLESESISVIDVTWERDRAVHERYRIEAVPATLLVDRGGEVRRSWVGVVEPGQLWSTVTEITGGDADPGTPAGAAR